MVEFTDKAKCPTVHMATTTMMDNLGQAINGANADAFYRKLINVKEFHGNNLLSHLTQIVGV